MNLDRIFKAYDVRGTYPDEIDEEAARRIGGAFARFTRSETVLVGRDMRTSSPSLAGAFIDGVTAAGANVIDIGLVSTDQVYVASGLRRLPGAMFTASHNPPQYNGIKMCGPGAAPIGAESGLAEIKELARSELEPSGARGSVEATDTLDEFVEHLLKQIDVSRMRPLTVVADAANGMGGKIAPAVFERLPVRLVELFFDLDGTFPNHPADPIQPENLETLRKTVLDEGADLGLAFDGDADRVFLVDEKAEPVSGSLTTALVAQRMLAKHPGSTVVYNVVSSRVVAEVIEEAGGTGVRARNGHSFIKQKMAETEAVFGGEHSGHYYFRENYRADSGILAALIVLEAMSLEGRPVSELLEPLKRYESSGEINIVMEDQQGAIDRVKAAFAEGEQDMLDGLTVNYPDWWFSLRSSNTEPLLRLNIEARDAQTVAAKRDQIMSIVGGG